MTLLRPRSLAPVRPTAEGGLSACGGVQAAPPTAGSRRQDMRAAGEHEIINALNHTGMSALADTTYRGWWARGPGASAAYDRQRLLRLAKAQ